LINQLQDAAKTLGYFLDTLIVDLETSQGG
jgi:hypothetical protein